MTVTMTSKHQITIPKRIAAALSLKQGAIFDVAVYKNKIELIPMEIGEKIFTEEEYKKLDYLVKKEHGQEKRVTKKFIGGLKKKKR